MVGVLKYSLAMARAEAKKREAKVLSKKYQYHLLWECKNGHIFQQPLGVILKKNIWCSGCAKNKKYTIEKANEVAAARNGKCLSTEYINSRSKLQWECKFGHTWEAVLNNVIHNEKWCPFCAGNKKYTIQDINAHIKDRGKCLSKKYLGARALHEFECNYGHKWTTSVSKIMNGRWCIYCCDSYPERVCRLIFETIFNEKFPKYKSNWLINTKNKPLELDGYCEKLGIAFEHHGAQHYSKNTLFSSPTLAENDSIKRKLLLSKNIKLFEVNQLFTKTKVKELLNTIYTYCIDNNIQFNNIDINKEYIRNNLVYYKTNSRKRCIKNQ